MNVPIYPPKPAVAVPTADAAQRSKVIALLLDSPEQISNSRAVYDQLNERYERELASLSVEALSRPLFPGKAEGEKRVAGNDKERELAVTLTLNQDAKMQTLAMDRAEALRSYQYQLNLFEAAKLAAQLLAR